MSGASSTGGQGDAAVPDQTQLRDWFSRIVSGAGR